MNNTTPRIYKKFEMNNARELKKKDIIINKISYKEEYNEKGEKVIKRIVTPYNVTKKVNETAKLLKQYTAQEKLKEFEKISLVR